MHWFWLVLFLASCCSCCNLHSTCEECLSQVDDCFWIYSFSNEYICTNELDGYFSLNTCEEKELPKPVTYSPSTISPYKVKNEQLAPIHTSDSNKNHSITLHSSVYNENTKNETYFKQEERYVFIQHKLCLLQLFIKENILIFYLKFPG